jgi:hypothetical protein
MFYNGETMERAKRVRLTTGNKKEEERIRKIPESIGAPVVEATSGKDGLYGTNSAHQFF